MNSNVTLVNEIETRVARGAALLDKKNPGWHDEIEVNDILVDSFISCPLAQLYGDWGKGCEGLGVTGDDSWQYGFDLGPNDEYRDTRLIDNAWMRLIESRRATPA